MAGDGRAAGLFAMAITSSRSLLWRHMTTEHAIVAAVPAKCARFFPSSPLTSTWVLLLTKFATPGALLGATRHGWSAIRHRRECRSVQRTKSTYKMVL